MISLRYLLSGWLILDFFALFPFRELGYEEIGYYLRLSRLGKMPQFFGSFSPDGIGVLFGWIKSTLSHRNSLYFEVRLRMVLRVLKVFFVVCFLAYFMACLWEWYIEYVSAETNYDDTFDSV
jgi:hypothetical protein